MEFGLCGLHAAVGAPKVFGGHAVFHVERVIIVGIEPIGRCSHLCAFAGLNRKAGCGIPGVEGGLTQRHRAVQGLFAGAQGLFEGRNQVDHGCCKVAHGAEQPGIVECLQFDGGQRVDVEALQVGLSVSHIAHAEAVVGHHGMCGSESAYAHGFHATGAAVVAHGDAGQTAQCIARIGYAALFKGHAVHALHRYVGADAFVFSQGGYFGGSQGVRVKFLCRRVHRAEYQTYNHSNCPPGLEAQQFHKCFFGKSKGNPGHEGGVPAS